ncbi:hypothetical protein CXF86_10960 [Shewanella sp. GutCb]|nr:hypothetical protein [Shewanella sp. GutCb]PKG74802.1 hypothetical protein CXF86_10960 [Shewanella sp. GutCb]
MFQTIKDNISMVIIATLLFCLVVAGISLASTRSALTTTKTKLSNAQASLALLQSDLDGVTADLIIAEQEKAKLLIDAAFTVSIISQREHERGQVDRAAAVTLEDTNLILGAANDEAINNWANSAVPSELNRLLKHTAYCANSDHQQDKVCITANGTEQFLSSG